MSNTQSENRKKKEDLPPSLQAVPANSLDRAILHLGQREPAESNCHLGGACRMLKPVPPDDHFHRLLSDAMLRIPALGYRLAGPLRKAHWIPSGDVDPNDHIQYYRATAGTNPHEALLQGLDLPLPHGRPLWSLLIIDGYSDTEYLLCYRCHHGFQDGMNALATIKAMVGGHSLPMRPPPPRRPTQSRIGDAVRSLRDVWPSPSPDPRWYLRPGTPRGRRLHVIHLDRPTIQQAAQAAQATIAHVALALIAGAMHHWAPDRRPAIRSAMRPASAGRPRRDPIVYMAVGLHDGRRYGGLGNHLGVFSFPLPCTQESAADRLNAVKAAATLDQIIKVRRNQNSVADFGYLVSRAGAQLARNFLNGRIVISILPGNKLVVPEAIESFPIPILPERWSGIFAVTDTPTEVIITCLTNTAVPDTHHIPDLIHQALGELCTAVSAPQPPPPLNVQ
jgi:hypothetical protein